MRKAIMLSFVGERDPFSDAVRVTIHPEEYPHDAKGLPIPKGKARTTFDPNLIGYSVADPSQEEADAEGAVVTLARFLHSQENLSEIYLFPTGGPTGTLPRGTILKRNIEALFENVKVTIIPLNVTDPTDFIQISNMLRPLLQEIVDATDLEEYKFHVNCSSGTQQMTSFLYVLMNMGYLPQALPWQVRSPRDAQDSGLPRLQKVPLEFLEEENILSRLEKYAENYSFDNIARECGTLRRISSSESRKKKAAALKLLFEAFSYMDLMRIQGAVQKTASCEQRQELLEFVVPYRDYLSHFGKESPNYTTYSIVELFKNMERCFDRGAYADVLARAWRILEAVFYACIDEQGISVTDKKKREKDIEKYIQEHALDRNQSRAVRNYVGDYDDMALTKAMEFAIGILKIQKCRNCTNAMLEKSFWSSKDPASPPSSMEFAIKRVREFRNNAFIAHAMGEVLPWQAECALKVAKKMLFDMMPETQKILETYPVTREKLLEMVMLLK